MADVRERILAECEPSYPAMFRARAAADPGAVAYQAPLHTEPERWVDITWAEAENEVDELAAGFVALGLQSEERVAIVAMTRIEWILADLAVACAGGATTTVYPNTKSADELFVLRDSGSVVVVAENWIQAQKVIDLHELDDQVRRIVLMDDDRPVGYLNDRLVAWGRLRDLGREYLAGHPAALAERMSAMGPETLSTLIYTSGTTGRPKGVELPHRCWTYEGHAMRVMWQDVVDESDSLYLWLPLSHVFGRDLVATQLAIGFRMVVDGRIDRIVEGMGETGPTIQVGVPRIYEKIRAAVMTMSSPRGVRGRVSRWAFAVGRESRGYRLAGQRMPWDARMRYSIADRLVFGRLRQTLGGRVRFMISGSAKLSEQVQEWFYSAGITVIEGYGATETAAIAAVNVPNRPRFGSVGPVTYGVDHKLAADGELLLRGPIIANGYHNMPEEGAEAFADGWFHTGDIGEFDEDGYLRITDRKKDLMKTSNGKYVAPQKVESTLLANVPYITQAVVSAENRPYAVALLTLDRGDLLRWAKNHGHGGEDYATLSQLPEIRASIDRYVRRANSRLERWETVKRYEILDHEFSQDVGELTPSLKVKRNVVLERYAEAIDTLYEQESRSDLTPDGHGA
ncbi:long-chain fatty acid--CoA ligase [uncultured Propionibacterium sp.]|uniref:AMP-dependent synthetase/ligase n=1 Tax=uncultured Propionibacterium sp. TaxID=218066 RepID=UPI00292FDCDD|nr:long-chain fatty acid--CoA ligase [uncultured Propionibacterium sp.]